jgi:cell wall assembly regulator SMI1
VRRRHVLTVAASVAFALLAAPACAQPKQLNVTEEPVARRTPGASSAGNGGGAYAPPSCLTRIPPSAAPPADPRVDARVGAAWVRIDGWLRAHAPATFASLGPPADPARITAAETAMSVRFPPELVASLRRHDGTGTGDPKVAFRLPPGYALLSVDASEQDRGARCRSIQPREGASWASSYVPFARDGADGCLFLDAHAAPGGGKVGMCAADGAVREAQPAVTLAELLDRTADALVTGQPYGRFRPYVNERGGLDWQES